VWWVVAEWREMQDLSIMRKILKDPCSKYVFEGLKRTLYDG
jgi:hypothetical protein